MHAAIPELTHTATTHSSQSSLQILHTDTAGDLPIVVHSHLRWDFVWQRPQHILTRLAANHRVVFIEEPVWGDHPSGLDITQAARNVVRIVPRMRTGAEREADDLPCAIQAAFDKHELLRGDFSRVIHWFYTPMAAPVFLGKFEAAAVVYDCMDELSKFRFAPEDLRRRERLLLKEADVVFTGGYQLFTAKSQHHRNVHFYGCGVEVEHYAKAREAGTVIHPDIAHLPRPVLGYFGVIDERLDYELIDRLAASFHDGSIVMIGPLAKVDRDTLPQRANIHWLGQQAYETLPRYVKGFDVCLMPFALNEATEHINPTKTLEYMAAGKPVVSTAVPDVVRNFDSLVTVAHTPVAFIEAAREACSAPDPGRIARGIARAADMSWDAVVAAMRGHVLSAVAARQARCAQSLVI
ncbi:MAG TPA: glycosyltransferase [Burkholderiales bacterium]|nr:glycosyltransferase [Burkholderiales bacterium]